MIKWKLIDDDEAESSWDKSLLRFSDYTIFQTFMWGEHKREAGWVPKRWIAFDEDHRAIAMAQGLLRMVPFSIALIWFPGGPVGDISAVGVDFFNFIRQTAGLKKIFCRFYLNREDNRFDRDILKKNHMTEARYSINSSMSMKHKLKGYKNNFITLCSKNWRHNYKRSQKYNFSIELIDNPDINKLLSIYRRMEDFKKIERQYSDFELRNIIEKLKEHIILYGCKDSSGELIGFRGCAVVGKKGWDLLAAVSPKGRRVYASYALFVALMAHCKDMGIEDYDMGGIDIIRNRGVYDFKKGTGALPFKYLGEWDWASNIWLLYLCNIAIRFRAGRL